MSAREQLVAVFQRVLKKPMGVKELRGYLPHLKREFVSKECVYMVTLGMLKSKMVSNRHHGRRYEFTSTDALLEDKDGNTMSVVGCVKYVLRYAPHGLSVIEMRHAIYGVLRRKIPKSDIKVAVDLMVVEQIISKMQGSNRKNPAYRFGGDDTVPWKSLDDAMRQCVERRGAFSPAKSIRSQQPR